MHKLFKISLLSCALSIATIAHATTYATDLVYGTNSIVGSVTTDGTLGVLGTGDITAFSFTITSTTGSEVISSSNGAEEVLGSSLTATATGLFFNYANSTGDALIFQTPYIGYYGENYVCLQGSDADCSSYTPDSVNFALSDAVQQADPMSGVELFAGTSASTTPEPSSLVLLSSGILGLAGAARRKFLKA